MISFRAIALGGSLTLGALASDLSQAAVTKTTEPLNLLSGPNPHDRAVAVVPVGSQINVVLCDPQWCLVTWGSRTGYSEGRYLVNHVTAKVPPLDKLKSSAPNETIDVDTPVSERLKLCASQWAI